MGDVLTDVPDVVKFLPGWLALLLSGYLALRTWRTQRLRRALGPDGEAVREALVDARRLLEEVCTRGGQRVQWFQKDEQREVGRVVQDLADRVGDKKLRRAMTAVAGTCAEVFAFAPPNRIMVAVAGQPEHPSQIEQRNRDQAQLAQQVERAHQGRGEVATAITRLNVVERRVTGR